MAGFLIAIDVFFRSRMYQLTQKLKDGKLQVLEILLPARTN